MRKIWQRKLLFRSGWEMLNPLKDQSNEFSSSTEENLNRAVNWIKSDTYNLKPLLTGVIPADIDEIRNAYQQLKNNPNENICFLIKWD